MRIITITGSSGAGKDTAARILSELSGIPLIVSYTTRPKRDEEEDGREHHFVEKCDANPKEMLAHTSYGGYEYWTTLSQLTTDVIYVIDEDGLSDLRGHFPDLDIVSIYISASTQTRIERGVTDERMERDKERTPLPLDFYNLLISNNKDMECLRKTLQEVADSIKSNTL